MSTSDEYPRRKLAILQKARSDVGDDGTVDLAVVRRRIEQALDRRAEREAARLELAVADGVVTVTGRMNSMGDKFVVLHLVRRAPGVRGVRDGIRVDP